MPNKKITELAVGTTPDGSELAEGVQGGVNKQFTFQQIADLGGGGSITSVNGDTGPAVSLVASEIPFTPVGSISATDVQAAIAEVASESVSPGYATAAEINTGSNTTKIIAADQLQLSKYETQYGLRTFALSTSAANTYTWNLSPVITTYGSGGLLMKVKFTNPNTGAATGNANTLGALSIVMPDGSALPAGAISANSTKILQYDGTNLVLINPSVISLGSATASTVAWWDSNKKLTSVAYASIAEMVTGTDAVKIPTSATIEGARSVKRASAALSSGTVTLDCANREIARFENTTTLSASHTLALSNESSVEYIHYTFYVTGTITITVPTNFRHVDKVGDLRWVVGSTQITIVGDTASPFNLFIWRINGSKFMFDPSWKGDA